MPPPAAGRTEPVPVRDSDAYPTGKAGDGEEAQAKAAALFAEMCERADRHLERLQLALKNSSGLMQKGSPRADRLSGIGPCAGAPSYKAVAALRLLLPCEEGWGPRR